MFREFTKVLWWTLTLRLPARLQQRSDIDVISESGLFDADFYLLENADVASTEVDAVAHYVIDGAREGRNPSPYFDTNYYLEQNADVLKIGGNPFAHFISFGAAEWRNPHPKFDMTFYMETNPCLANARVNGLLHYVEVGVQRGCRTHPHFASLGPVARAGESALQETPIPPAAAPSGARPAQGAARIEGRIEGLVDRYTQSSVAGWARDSTDPARSVVVDLSVDGEVLRSVSAGRYRGDLERRFSDGGNHGFIWEYAPLMFEERSGDVSIEPRDGVNDIVQCRSVIPSFVKAKRLDGVQQAQREPAIVLESVPESCDDTPLWCVDIIVLNRDGASLLQEFFAAFDEFNTYPVYSITIVDHGSTDESEAVVEKWAERLDVHWMPRHHNYTFSESNNFAARSSDADVLIFANNDIYLNSDVLGSLVAMLADETLSLVGIKLLDVAIEGSGDLVDSHPRWIQHLGVHFDRFRRDRFSDDGQLIAPFETRAAPLTESFEGAAVATPAVTGAFVATRRRDFIESGGFDEGYFYGYEDVDLCLKAILFRDKRVVCANHLTALHDRGHSRGRMDRKAALRVVENRQLLDRRFGYAYRRRMRSDLFARPGFWNVSVPRIAFAVTEASHDATAGDYFTSLELARELEAQFSCQCYFLERGRSWYDLSGIDVVIAMVDQYDLSLVENASPNLIKVAWVRNWFERFAANSSANAYNLVWASSGKAARYLEEKLGKCVSVFPLATNAQAFKQGNARDDLSSDYCFTGHHWQQARDIMSHLDHRSIPFEGKIFGQGWDEVEELRDLAHGPLPYREMPDVYASTKLVIDDANHVTKPWGSVNSRVFDALAAGRLVVTNGAAGSEEIFEGILPSYQTPEELSQLIQRYLQDEGARDRLVGELREVVEAKHTYRHRAAEAWRQISEAARTQLRFAIKIGAPTDAIRDEWGDYHFAVAMKRVLERLGHYTRIDCIDHWYGPETFGDDVVIVLRGLSQYEPRVDHINLIWLISHPDVVRNEELEGYDHVFVASRSHAETLGDALEVSVSTLLQCTDPEVFVPPGRSEPGEGIEGIDVPANEGIVLVGNSRNQFRQIVRDCLEAEVEFKVVGTRWENLVEENRILAQHIPNDELSDFYSRCELVLNDHWATMRNHGFLSNRLFDAAACGAQILTDRVEGLEEIFGDVVLTYEGAEELARVARSASATLQSERSRRMELAQRIREEHSFEVRVREILGVVRSLDKIKVLGQEGSSDAAVG